MQVRQNDPQCQRRVVLRLHLSAASRWEADVTTLHRGWFESKFLVRNSSDQLQKWSCEVWSCLVETSRLLFEEKPFAEVDGSWDCSDRRLLGSNCPFLAICWIKWKGKWKAFKVHLHILYLNVKKIVNACLQLADFQYLAQQVEHLCVLSPILKVYVFG